MRNPIHIYRVTGTKVLGGLDWLADIVEFLINYILQFLEKPDVDDSDKIAENKTLTIFWIIAIFFLYPTMVAVIIVVALICLIVIPLDLLKRAIIWIVESFNESFREVQEKEK